MSSQVFTVVPRVFGAAALLSAMLVAPAVAAPTDYVGEACTGDEGVTVVVDFTDFGGDVEVACAEGTQDSGRAALEAAGFTPEDSQPGMICAIDSSPDPCPEEFDGNFWSYWTGDDAGEWEMYMVGADEAEPAPGAIEGWRYSDGEEGPVVNPAALGGQTSDGDIGTDDADDTTEADQDQADQEAEADEDAEEEAPTEEPTEEDTATDDADETADETDSDGSGFPAWAGVLIGLGIIGAIAAVIVRRKNDPTA